MIMEISDSNEDAIATIKNLRNQLESRISTIHTTQQDLFSSLQNLVPDLVSSVDLSLQVISLFNHRPFSPTPPNPNSPNLKKNPILKPPHELKQDSNNAPQFSDNLDEEKFRKDEPLTVVREMVAGCLLQRVPFSAIDSSTVLRKLENDSGLTAVEKAAVWELGGESGAIVAVETALRSIAADDSSGGGVDLEEFVVSGVSRLMVLGIDRARVLKKFPSLVGSTDANNTSYNQNGVANNGVVSDANEVSTSMPRGDMWIPQMYPGPSGPMMGPRGGAPRMIRGGMGFQRPQMMNVGNTGVVSVAPQRMQSEEDELKDLEDMLRKKSYMEKQKSKISDHINDLLHRPTAKETAVAAQFKSKGGSQVKEYCKDLTKEDCRNKVGSYIACEKVHFRRIVALHTDVMLGDCSFLDTCRHMKTCKYIHYELDSSPDVLPMMVGAPQKPLKPQRAEYCSAQELGEPQWINCDIRNFRMDILGQFGVIMADPPWDIHMELPYGTMADDEMRTLNVPALQTDGLIFLWVTGRAMELGRECLELWGYKRVEEIIWVKTNQLQRIIRTGRTGHWLNHSKEHCLVGIKGDPEVNRNIDTDVIVAEVRETSRKPDEMYALLERISPRTRKLELFARMHNTQAGWMALGNQLSGVRLVDDGLRARFKAAYPDVEVQPTSPPRVSAVEIDTNNAVAQVRSPFTGMDSKSMSTELPIAPDMAYVSEERPTPMAVDA